MPLVTDYKSKPTSMNKSNSFQKYELSLENKR